MKRVGVLIGRFQPRHRGHNAIIQQAANQCDHLLVLIGSANRPKSVRNPWNYAERWLDLKSCMANDICLDREFSVYPLNDYRYNYPQWIADVEGAVQHLRESNHQHFNGWHEQPILFGHTKPDTNYMKRDFPHWEYVNLESGVDMDATTVRNCVFGLHTREDTPEEVRRLVTQQVNEVTNCQHSWTIDPNLIDDWKWLKEEKERFKNHPYPETLQFDCADAVVECAGHLLVIERGNSPGKGVLALPGGFKEHEPFFETAVRELMEETNLRVAEKVLRGSMVKFQMYDSPFRGHGIPRNTMAYHFKLEPNPVTHSDGPIPRASPKSDARKAMWLPFHDLLNNHTMHDDHQDIVYDMLGALPIPAHLNPAYPKYSRTL